MSRPNNGGPAFPSGVSPDDYFDNVKHPVNEGMSLRDYFAARAPFPPSPGLKADADARLRYGWADAMLKAREVSS